MRLPEEFLNEYDRSVNHGTFEKTRKMIDSELEQFLSLEKEISGDISIIHEYTPQQLINYFMIKSTEAELFIETGKFETAVILSNQFISILEDLINNPMDFDDLLIDYLKFAKTEFMRTIIDMNRREGNLEEIDQMLREIDNIHHNLSIPKDSPRFIKSQAYNRNYHAILQWNYGNPEKAKELFLECISDFERLQAPADVALMYNNLGLTYLMQSKFNHAITYFEQTLEYYKDKPNPMVEATILNNLGESFREIGDIPQALDYHQKTLKLRQQNGIDADIAQSHLFIGSILQSDGQLDEALSNFESSLEINTQIGHNLNISRLMYHIGEIYLDRGEFDQAESHFKQSISHLEESGNSAFLADIYHGIGTILREKGHFEDALSEFRQSAKFREKIGNNAMSAIAKCEMVECQVLLNRFDEASELLDKIKIIVENHPEHKILGYSHQLAHATYYHYQIRVRDKVKAENIYREILKSPVIPYKLQVRTTKRLIELLIEELQNYGQEIVLVELIEYLDQLEELAKRQSLSLLLTEIYLIRHQLQYILGKVNISQEYLKKAQNIVDTLNVPILAEKVEQVARFYNENLKTWENLDRINLNLEDRLKLSFISSSLEKSRNLLHLYQNNSNYPLLILVFGEGGTISLSYTFKSYKNQGLKINPHLIASFMSALNSFGRDTFDTSEFLENLNYGNHKLVSRKIDNLIISLLFEGTNLRTKQQMDEFEVFFKESGILEYIRTNPLQEFILEEKHKDIIEDIFN